MKLGKAIGLIVLLVLAFLFLSIGGVILVAVGAYIGYSDKGLKKSLLFSFFFALASFALFELLLIPAGIAPASTATGMIALSILLPMVFVIDLVLSLVIGTVGYVLGRMMDE